MTLVVPEATSRSRTRPRITTKRRRRTVAEDHVRRDAADAELSARDRGRAVRDRRRRHRRRAQDAACASRVLAGAARARRRRRGTLPASSTRSRRTSAIAAAVAEARPRRRAAPVRRDGEPRAHHVRRGHARRRSRGTPRFVAHFVRIAAHELAHSGSATPSRPRGGTTCGSSEAFASGSADKLASAARRVRRRGARAARSRASGRSPPTTRIDARPLHRAVADGADADDQFDAIATRRARRCSRSFERSRAEDRFAARSAPTSPRTPAARPRRRIRSPPLATATSPALAHALAVDIDLAGAPIATVSASCGAAPKLAASARNGIVPLCYRTSTEACTLVSERAEMRRSARRPSWATRVAAAIT